LPDSSSFIRYLKSKLDPCASACYEEYPLFGAFGVCYDVMNAGSMILPGHDSQHTRCGRTPARAYRPLLILSAVALKGEIDMSEVRMTAEIRTDFECEATGLPAERWGEAVFKIQDQEIVLEVSVEKEIIVAIMVDEATAWKGTLAGLRQLLKNANAGPPAQRSDDPAS
jgi:hypothetical protein